MISSTEKIQGNTMKTWDASTLWWGKYIKCTVVGSLSQDISWNNWSPAYFLVFAVIFCKYCRKQKKESVRRKWDSEELIENIEDEGICFVVSLLWYFYAYIYLVKYFLCLFFLIIKITPQRRIGIISVIIPQKVW